MVEIADLHMHFGAVRALTGVSFVARDGAITGRLGENGAGKTTTLNIVAGLHEPVRGSVAIDGGSAGDPIERRRHVGALLDDKGLYPRLRARENVSYFGELRGLVVTTCRGESSARSRPSVSSRLPTGRHRALPRASG